ncbi:MAG: hypothetical protein WCX82_01860 [archaeon]|jgi:hypothetical protein
MNVTITGITEKILNKMIEEGYASTKSEAIRLAIISFGKSKQDIEIEMVNRKIAYIEEQVKLGKRKTLTPEEALGDYAKYITYPYRNTKSKK